MPRWTVLAGLIALALPAPAAAADADEVLLRIERPVAFYEVLPAVARQLGPILEVADERSVPVVIETGERAVRAAFDAGRASADIRAALAAVPDGEAALNDALADRFLAADAATDRRIAALLSMTEAERQAEERKALADLDAREDKAAIVRLAGLMAGPDVAAEATLAQGRMKLGFEGAVLVSKAKLRATTPARIAAEIGTLLSTSRDLAPAEDGMPFNRAMVEDSARQRLEILLAGMSAEDVGALLRFYASPAGTAKRDALLSALRGRSDADMQQALVDLLSRIRELP